MIFEMRFGPVAQAATEWMDALSQNAEAVFKDADQRGEFLSNEKDVRKFIDVARCLDRLRITRAPEGKTWHTSIHLQFAPEAKGK